MAIHVESEHDTGVASLIAGIMADARQLIVQQFTLFQVEIKNDIHRTLTALIPIVAGGAIFAVAMLLLLAAASLFLPWYFPDLPTWAGFAIVGSVIGATGVILFVIGNTMLSKVNPLPEKAMEGLKENLQWKTKN